MKKRVWRASALALSLLLLLPFTAACGGGKGTATKTQGAEQTTAAEETVKETAAETTAAAKQGAKTGAVQTVKAGQDGFVIDIPGDFTFDSNMSCYVSPDKKVKIWPADMSMTEKQSNFDDMLASIKGPDAKEVTVGSYKVTYMEEKGSFYGPTTQYMINFNGRYKDFYGARIMVTGEGTDLASTRTPEIIEWMKTIRKEGDPVDFKPGEKAAATTAAATTEAAPVSPFAGLKVNFKPEDTAAMSNFMNSGQYAADGKKLYGLAFGSDGNPLFAAFDLTEDGSAWKAANPKVINKGKDPYNVMIHGDALYYIFGDEGLFKAGKDGSNPTLLVKDAADYAQIAGDKIYYCDKDYRFWQAGLDGSSPTKVLDKEIYCPYVISKDFLLYQDDADGESLHLRHLSSGTDIVVSALATDVPIIAGSSIYCTVVKDNVKQLAKIDLGGMKIDYDKAAKTFKYTFPTEYSGKTAGTLLAISQDGYIYNGTDKGLALADWNKVENPSDQQTSVYKFSNADVKVFWEMKDDTVTDISLTKVNGGGITSLPRVD